MVHHLYFHIPFCHRICPYCGFYKHQPGSTSFEQLADALIGELAAVAKTHPVQPHTLYFGGGTPSIFPTALWERFAAQLRDTVDCQYLEEWNLEANPKTFDASKAEAWRAAGVTRASLGVQSFDPFILERLGRDHSPKEAAQGVADLRKGGFEVVNIDLMFSIPGQTIEIWRDTLQAAIDLESEHISAYNLTYEEDTPYLDKYISGKWQVDSDRDAEFFALADEMLGKAGFDHYEVSNYSKPGFRSTHNQAYWAGRDYLGLGPSAVSTVGVSRWKNISDTAAYVRMIDSLGYAKAEEERLSEEDRRLERLGLGLRADPGLFRAGFDTNALDHLAGGGLIEYQGDRFRLTLKGMMVADEVAGYLA